MYHPKIRITGDSIRGGPKPAEFSEEERYTFQLNLIKAGLQLEKTFEDLAQSSKQNCIIICDRGVMDAKACKENNYVCNSLLTKSI